MEALNGIMVPINLGLLVVMIGFVWRVSSRVQESRDMLARKVDSNECLPRHAEQERRQLETYHAIDLHLQAIASGVTPIKKQVGEVASDVKALLDRMTRVEAKMNGGPRGDRGVQGDRGMQGERGIQGEHGIQGLPGE